MRLKLQFTQSLQVYDEELLKGKKDYLKGDLLLYALRKRFELLRLTCRLPYNELAQKLTELKQLATELSAERELNYAEQNLSTLQ